MKRSMVVAFLCCLACVSAPAQETPDTQYIGIYTTLQQADSLSRSGAAAEALTKYRDAEAALKKFQTNYPNWNTNVVRFRLNDIASKIKPLEARLGPINADTTPKPAQAPATATTTASTTGDLENQVKTLQQQIQQVESEKAALQAQLKEPAAAGPESAASATERLKVDDRIQALQKENDLLKSGLTQQKAPATVKEDAALLAQTKQALAEADQKLAQQNDRITELTREKMNLATEVARLSTNGASATELEQTRQALVESNRKLAEQTQATRTLAREKETLQKSLDAASGNTPASADLASTRQSLVEANQKLARQSNTVASLEKQVADLSTAAAPGAPAGQAQQAMAEANRKLQSQVDASALVLAGKEREATASLKLIGEQRAAMESLTREKETLQKRIGQLTAAGPKTTVEVEQVNLLQTQVRQLESDKTSLEARLKEALSARPATADPRELVKAEDRIKSLQKENDLLRTTLEQKQAASLKRGDADALEETRRQLDAANRQLERQAEATKEWRTERESLQGQLQKLNSQIESADKLNAENESLRKQLAAANTGTPDARLAALQQTLDASNHKLEDQADYIKSLNRERELLQVKLSQKSSPGGTAVSNQELDQTKALLEEARRTLERQSQASVLLIAEATTKLETQTKLAESLQQQTASLQKQLASKPGDDTTTVLRTENESLRRQLASVPKPVPVDDSVATALRAENEALRRQLATAAASKPAGSPAAEQARLAALQSDLDLARMEKQALEQRIRKMQSQVVARPATNTVRRTPQTAMASAPATTEQLKKVRQLEQERDTLQRSLEETRRQLGARTNATGSTARLNQMTNQLSNLRARLVILEAKPVPYSDTELALLRLPGTKLATTPTTTATIAPTNTSTTTPTTTTPTPTAAITAAAPTATKRTNSPAAKTKAVSAESRKLMAEAQQAFAAREFVKAEAAYTKVLEQDGDSVVVLANLASIQLELERNDEAAKNLRKALALNPNDAYSLKTLGSLKFREHKYDEAFDLLSRAAQLEPDNAEIQNFLGVTLSHKGLRSAAETALRKALQLNPNYGAAHNNLAMVYATQSPPALELARWHYQKARTAGAPANPDLEKLLGSGTAAKANP